MDTPIMQTEQNHAAEEMDRALSSCRVLLVEDDADEMARSKKALESAEHVEEVKCFSNGAELIAYMREQGFQDHSVNCETPTLIVIDLNMPKMDGYRILEQLKSDWFLADMPVIVVTGETSYKAVHQARVLGADGVFHKPMNAGLISQFFSQAWQWQGKEARAS